MVWQHFVKGILGGFTASEVGTRWDNHVCHSTSQQLFGERQKDKNTFWERSNTKVNSAWVAEQDGCLFLGTSRATAMNGFAEPNFLLIFTLLPLVRCKLLKMGNWGSKKRVFEGGFECVLKGKVAK